MTLPLPPSINRQYATVNGRRVLSSTGRRYKETIAQLLMAVASSSGWHAFLQKAQEHCLALTVHCCFPTLLRRDLDGGLKITQDAVCEAMGLNDNRVMEIHLYKTVDRDNPRLECTLALASPLASGIRQSSRRSNPLRRSSPPTNLSLPKGKTKGRSPNSRR